MNDDELAQSMKKVQEVQQEKKEKTSTFAPLLKIENSTILAEFPITSTEMHKIANGDCCVINAEQSAFSIRFLLKNSFKSPRSNFVINKYVIQILVSEKQKFMRKEEIAVRTKVVKGQSAKGEKKDTEKIETSISESKKDLFSV